MEEYRVLTLLLVSILTLHHLTYGINEKCVYFQENHSDNVLVEGHLAEVELAFNISLECQSDLVNVKFVDSQTKWFCDFNYINSRCFSLVNDDACICTDLQDQHYVKDINKNIGLFVNWTITGTYKNETVFKKSGDIRVRSTETTFSDFLPSASPSFSSSESPAASTILENTSIPVTQEDSEDVDTSVDHTSILYLSVGVVLLLLIVVTTVFGVLFCRKVLSNTPPTDKSTPTLVAEPAQEAQEEVIELQQVPVRDRVSATRNRESALTTTSDAYQEINEDSISTIFNSSPSTAGWATSEFDSDPEINDHLATTPNQKDEHVNAQFKEADYENQQKEIVFENDRTPITFENDRKEIVFENEFPDYSSAYADTPVGFRIVHHCKPPPEFPVDSTGSDYLNPTASKNEKQEMKKPEGDDYLNPTAQNEEEHEAKKPEANKEDDYLNPVASKNEKRETQKHNAENEGDLEGAVGGASNNEPSQNLSREQVFASGARPKVGVGRSRFQTSTKPGKKAGRRNTDHDIRSQRNQPQQMFSHVSTSLGHLAGSLIHFTKFQVDEHFALDDDRSMDTLPFVLGKQEDQGAQIIPQALSSQSDSSESDGYLRPGERIFKGRKKSRYKVTQSSQFKMETGESAFHVDVPKPARNLSAIRSKNCVAESSQASRGKPSKRTVFSQKAHRFQQPEQVWDTASGSMLMDKKGDSTKETESPYMNTDQTDETASHYSNIDKEDQGNAEFNSEIDAGCLEKEAETVTTNKCDQAYQNFSEEAETVTADKCDQAYQNFSEEAETVTTDKCDQAYQKFGED